MTTLEYCPAGSLQHFLAALETQEYLELVKLVLQILVPDFGLWVSQILGVMLELALAVKAQRSFGSAGVQ